MANRHRGEIEACLSGKTYKLCLTLGALAELEGAFGDDDMLALAERFGTGRISAKDATRVIAAGLRGGGHKIADDDVKDMQAEGGAAGFIGIVAQLLGATFGGPAGAVAGAVAGELIGDAIDQVASAQQTREGASGAPDPFPGTR